MGSLGLGPDPHCLVSTIRSLRAARIRRGCRHAVRTLTVPSSRQITSRISTRPCSVLHVHVGAQLEQQQEPCKETHTYAESYRCFLEIMLHSERAKMRLPTTTNAKER